LNLLGFKVYSTRVGTRTDPTLKGFLVIKKKIIIKSFIFSPPSKVIPLPISWSFMVVIGILCLEDVLVKLSHIFLCKSQVCIERVSNPYFIALSCMIAC
jgi:hypothetical protein